MQMKFIKGTDASGTSDAVNRALAEGWEFVKMQTCATQPSAHSYSDGAVQIIVVLQRS